jgi:hypothetical protein
VADGAAVDRGNAGPVKEGEDQKPPEPFFPEKEPDDPLKDEHIFIRPSTRFRL